MRIQQRIAILIALLTLASASALLQQTTSDAERQLFNAVNQERKAHGLPSLAYDEALANAARKHAKRMAEHDLAPVSRRAQLALTSESGRRSLHLAFRKRGRGTKSNRHSRKLHEVSPAPRQHPG